MKERSRFDLTLAWRRGALFLWAVLAGWAALLWLWPPAYLAFTVDDSFYYLQIARNLAEGHGITFDRLQLTNGFHPLWLFTITPFGWLPGDTLPVFAVLGLQLVLVMGGLFAECRVIRGAVSEEIFDRGLCLPSGSSLTEADLERVAGIVRGCCREVRARA